MPWITEGWPTTSTPPPVSGGYNNAETVALETSITPTPTAPWLTAVDTCISSLKFNGVWSKLDLFYWFGAPNLDGCTWNWVNTAVGRLTPTGSLTQVANSYLVSNGTTGWLLSSFACNSGLAQNGSAHFGQFILSEHSADSVSAFQSSVGRHFLGMASSATGASINSFTGGLNTSTTASFGSLWGSTAGHLVLQQNTTTQLEMFLDGVSRGTSTQTSSVDGGTVQIFRTAGGAYTTRRCGGIHYGAKLTAAEQLNLSKAIYKLAETLGVRPKVGGLGLPTGPTNPAPYKRLPTGNGNNMNMPVTSNLNGLIQCRAGAYPYAGIRVNDPNYLNLHRFEIRGGDAAPFDGTEDRFQFNCSQSILHPWQTTGDISFSFFIETGSANNHNNFFVMPDLHDQTSGPNCGPAAQIYPGTGEFYVGSYDIGSNTQRNSPRFACAQGVWHRIRINYRVDNNPNGFIRAWYDGVQIFNFTGLVGGGSGQAPYWWNVALYRGNNQPGPYSYWLANLEVDASGTSPFTSRIANPLPVPALV